MCKPKNNSMTHIGFDNIFNIIIINNIIITITNNNFIIADCPRG